MQSTGQTSMHFSSFVQLSTITKAMNHFSSDKFVKFQTPHRSGAPGIPDYAAASTTEPRRMCNSSAKGQALFVAYSERKSDSELARWIERPSVGVKLPTSDLGLSQLSRYIAAANADSNDRMGSRMEKADSPQPDSPPPDSSMKNSSWKTEVLLPGSWRGATCTLLSRGHHHIIVDTGMPHEAHRLLGALEKRGLHTTDIRMVVNTHFHVDHVLNNCLFPESEIYGSQQSHDWCCEAYDDLLDEQNWEKLSLKYYPESADYERAAELMGALRRFALRWWDRKRLGDPSRFRWIEAHPLPDDLEFMVTNGHVPGHVSVIVHHGEQPIIIAGDAVLTREHDESVFTMIPHNREQFQNDRTRILARMGRILPGHDCEFSNRSGAAPTPS